ncbi:MAG: hypothetical protein HQM09_12050 [Candidatus Riflebacteria bacterium]|nr:hypothetical protein [Candidatus Riflebacteria bacterium]
MSIGRETFRFFCRLLIFAGFMFSMNSQSQAASELKITGAIEKEVADILPLLEKCQLTDEKLKWPLPDGSYRGTYEFRGYALGDLLKIIGVKKKTADGFDRELDMYIQVIGKGGEKAAFSYGEVFLGAGNNDVMIFNQARFLMPHKHDDLASMGYQIEKWMDCSSSLPSLKNCESCHAGPKPPKLSIPKGFSVVAMQDGWPGRCIEDVVEIRVCQVASTPEVKLTNQERDVMWVEDPQIVLLSGEKISAGTLIGSTTADLQIQDCSFGLGKGFHGIHPREGFDLGGLLKKRAGSFDPKNCYLLVTGADGYRSLFSGGEVFLNPINGNVCMMVAEDREILKKGYGKYKVYSQRDFFIDRSVRAVREISWHNVE